MCVYIDVVYRRVDISNMYTHIYMYISQYRGSFWGWGDRASHHFGTALALTLDEKQPADKLIDKTLQALADTIVEAW